MSATKEWDCFAATWVIIAGALLMRLVLSSQFLISPDEANYWQWSRYLELGYHDHPPMIAWTIWLATKIFGQNEFAVRLPSVLGLSIASVYIANLAGRWFSWRCAFHTTLLLQGILLYNGAALVATPDGMLLPCWAGAIYHAGIALERGKLGQWLLTGVWFGLGLLSKYTILLFLPSLLIYSFFANRYRARLFRPEPWFGFIMSIIIFIPVIIWNSKHEWATFRHVLYMGGANDSNFFTLNYVGDFLASQVAVLSPVFFFSLLLVWFKGTGNKRLRNDDAQFLMWTSLTTFLIFFFLSLHSRVYGNWPAAGYLTGIVLLATAYSPGRPGYDYGSKHRLWKTIVVTAYLLCIPVLIQPVFAILPLPVDLDRTARETKGWDTLGLAVNEAKEKMPNPDNTFVFGLRYQIASELAFYMPGQPRTVSINRWNRPNVYDYWFKDEELIGKDGIGVTRNLDSIAKLRQIFKKVDEPQEIKIYRHSPWHGEELVKTLYIYKGYGFKGGLSWIPQDKNDIRAKMK
ncbi:MAG: glycosyltransferase family 39 protein [Desulfobulbaceae bacterium]|nr:glycosyltransferase family 39 protein [Desulfobulbaceae bacterium]